MVVHAALVGVSTSFVMAQMTESISDSSPVATSVAEPAIPAFDYSGLTYVTAIPPCAVSIADLRRLYRDLSAKTAEALDRQISTFERPPDMTEKQFETLKQHARAIGALTAIVDGTNGERIVSSSETALQNERLPERIAAITFDSAAAIQTQNVTPLNRFTLKLDFSEPPGFNVYNPWDKPTPNSSQLEVLGPDHTWVTAVHEATLAFFARRRRHRGWLHSPVTFNLLNYFVGFPAALWVVYRIDSKFAAKLSGIHVALRGVMDVYLFLLALLVFRIVVGGFRLIFPVVELEGARSIRARVALGTVLGSVVLALLYDILKALLT